MTVPVRLQLSRAKGFNLQLHSAARNGLAAVNVARPSPWGNPFIVGEAGDRATCIDRLSLLLGGTYAPASAAPFEAQRVFVEHAGRHWKTLKGKNLACWCGPDQSCHADVLLELANRPVCTPAPEPA